MTHRALQVLEAIDAALPEGTLVTQWKPDQTATVIMMGALSGEGDPAPENIQRATSRLTVAIDIYVYELDTDWLAVMFQRLTNAHRAVMADEPGGTYDALPWVRAAWIGDASEPEVSTETDRSFAYLRAEFFVDYSHNPADPET